MPFTPQTSPLRTTSATANDLVDLTYANWSYYEEFPSLAESCRRLSPPCVDIDLPSPVPSRASDVTQLSPFSPRSDSDLNSGGLETSSKRKSFLHERTEILDSPECDSKRPSKEVCTKKKPRLEWVLENNFPMDHEQDALDALHQLSPPGYNMSKNQPYINQSGDVIQCYRCSGEKRNKCHFKAKVVYDSTENMIFLYSSSTHDHQKQSKHTIGLPPKLKPIIHEGVNDGIMPAKLHRKILEKYPTSKVTLQQVQTACKWEADKLLSSLKGNTIGDLHTYLSENTLSKSSRKHAFGVLHGWRANGPIDLESEAADICFVMTTKNLLRNAVRQSRSELVSFLDIDQTYSLNERGYPVTVVGTVTRSHQFKLIAIGVSRHEDQQANELILETIKDGMRELIDFEWTPRVAMSDRAGAIANALTAVWDGLDKLAKCYFHVKKALKDNRHRFSSETNFEKFQNDCSLLAAFDDEDQFLEGLRLLDRKWRAREKDAMNWFLKEWATEAYRAWFSGFTPPGLPNTNNAVERFNRSIKVYVTSHQRLSFSKLITKFRKELTYRSLSSHSSDFWNRPQLNRRSWCAAQLWAKQNKANFLEAKNDNLFFCPSSELLHKLEIRGGVSKPAIRKAFSDFDKSLFCLDGENFDSYISRRRMFWKLQKQPNSRTFTCNCPSYLHTATCKHSLGMSILHQFVSIPPKWKCNTIEQMRKRGRPKSVQNCLEKAS